MTMCDFAVFAEHFHRRHFRQLGVSGVCQATTPGGYSSSIDVHVLRLKFVSEIRSFCCP